MLLAHKSSHSLIGEPHAYYVYLSVREMSHVPAGHMRYLLPSVVVGLDSVYDCHLNNKTN